jgi:hypothetical protein
VSYTYWYEKKNIVAIILHIIEEQKKNLTTNIKNKGLKKEKQIVDIKKKEIQIPDGRQMIMLIEKKKEIAKTRGINSIRVYNINTEHTKLIIKPESRSHR